MTDIVERLAWVRDPAKGPLTPHGQDIADALAEIERLRAHIVVLEAEVIRTAGAMRKLHEEHIREEPFRVDYDQPPNTPR